MRRERRRRPGAKPPGWRRAQGKSRSPASAGLCIGPTWTCAAVRRRRTLQQHSTRRRPKGGTEKLAERSEEERPGMGAKGLRGGLEGEGRKPEPGSQVQEPRVSGALYRAHLDLCRGSPKANTTTTFHSAPPVGRYREAAERMRGRAPMDDSAAPGRAIRFDQAALYRIAFLRLSARIKLSKRNVPNDLTRYGVDSSTISSITKRFSLFLLSFERLHIIQHPELL